MEAPTWKERLEEMQKKKSIKDVDKMFERYSTAHNRDVGFAGPNGGGVFVRQNAVIDIFAKEGLGIQIDPDTNSVSIYASKINLNGSTVDINTSGLMALRVNKFPLNLTPTFTSGNAGGPVVITPATIYPYNTGMQDVAKFVSKTTGALIGGI